MTGEGPRAGPERDPHLEALKLRDGKHEAMRAASRHPTTPAEAERIRALCHEASRLISERMAAAKADAPRPPGGGA